MIEQMNKILGNKKVYNIINESKSLNFVLDDNSYIVINYYSGLEKSIDINVEQHNNSKLVINFSGISKNDINVKINVNVLGNDNECIINSRVIASNGFINLTACVKDNENTTGNKIIEDLKGINENGSILLEPVLEIDSCEVDAEHFATIGTFSDDELFYLQSKGLSLDAAYILLKRHFLYSLFSKNFINLIEGRDENE